MFIRRQRMNLLRSYPELIHQILHGFVVLPGHKQCAGHLPALALRNDRRYFDELGSCTDYKRQQSRHSFYASRRYVNAVICSDTSPIRNTITAALHIKVLPLVRRPSCT